MKVLSSNKELYDYLVSLSLELKLRGAAALSELITLAIGNAASSSTEFLGESRIALKRILGQENGILTNQERDDLLDVLKQLEKAFTGR
jgi:hypothetical protein